MPTILSQGDDKPWQSCSEGGHEEYRGQDLSEVPGAEGTPAGAPPTSQGGPDYLFVRQGGHTKVKLSLNPVLSSNFILSNPHILFLNPDPPLFLPGSVPQSMRWNPTEARWELLQMVYVQDTVYTPRYCTGQPIQEESVLLTLTWSLYCQLTRWCWRATTNWQTVRTVLRRTGGHIILEPLVLLLLLLLLRGGLLHELFHVFGVMHTQKRPDRDRYL